MFSKLQKKLLLTLTLLLILGGSVTVLAAAGGSADNPLVTLSYLKTTFTELILRQTDEKLEAAREKYAKSLDDKIAAFSNEMKQLSGGGDAATFRLVELADGKSLTFSAGSELVARDGSLRCGSGASLLDVTTGQPQEGGALTKNHLYLVSGDSCAIQSSGASKILLRGTAQ